MGSAREFHASARAGLAQSPCLRVLEEGAQPTSLAPSLVLGEVSSP